MKSKHEEKKFICATGSCGYEFARKDIFKKHYIKCKRKQNEKEVQDAEKDLEFIESLVETQQMQNNNNECANMPNTFENKFLKFNLDEPEFCDKCPKTFSKKIH